MKKTTTRVQFELAEKSFERLNTLKEATESSSYAEVIKNALRVYENLIAHHDSGKQFFLKDREGNITEYQVF